MDKTKRCGRCGIVKALGDFYTRKDRINQTLCYCKSCQNEYSVDRKHKRGANRPLSDAKECGSYLGIIVAERALSRFFNHIERMPTNNPGYDFLCGKQKRIDVKSACLYKIRYSWVWQFGIKRNVVADYFLCLAFNNREDLEPMHVWLIPGDMVNDHVSIGISNTRKSLEKWSEYEQPLDKVVACCQEMKTC